ncbi:MAG TPA: polyketide cyclase, partial [Leeuwenhoekiella sp.]|nr:polyketide cyclase [Leeuwenhoekiella sp.]
AVSTPNPGITNIAWGFSGKYNFPFTIVSHFMSMDKMVGKDFEAGLKNLKEILEDN